MPIFVYTVFVPGTGVSVVYTGVYMEGYTCRDTKKSLLVRSFIPGQTSHALAVSERKDEKRDISSSFVSFLVSFEQF